MLNTPVIPILSVYFCVCQRFRLHLLIYFFHADAKRKLGVTFHKLTVANSRSYRLNLSNIQMYNLAAWLYLLWLTLGFELNLWRSIFTFVVNLQQNYPLYCFSWNYSCWFIIIWNHNCWCNSKRISNVIFRKIMRHRHERVI